MSYLLLAQDPVVSLSLCDRLKPVLGSGASLLLQLRDGARGVQEVGWFVSEVLSESEADEADRLPREEDFGVDDVLPMAAELVEWVGEGLGVAELPMDDDDDWVCFDLADVTESEDAISHLLLGWGFSWETCWPLNKGKISLKLVGTLYITCQHEEVIKEGQG